jgi:RNA polymerase sigma-70 factor (ECF subfamily)
MMMTMTLSDQELYRAHAEELIRYATVLVGPDDAPDVVTDAVLSAFATPAWSQVAQPRAYLYRSVLNTALSSHRARERRRRRETAVAMRPVAPESSPAESAIDVHRALATLSPQQRAVVFLAYWQDQPPSQIAATLDVSEGTVRKQLARARAQLRKVIDHA